jgi:quinoprotein glucose dehydrogenase
MKQLSLLFTVFILFTGDLPIADSAGKNWLDYNGDGTRSHYSRLTEVNKENVNWLKVA